MFFISEDDWMKYFLMFLLIYGCSQVPKKPENPEHEMVSLESTYDQIRSSYLKGCVDAFHHLKVPVSFVHCRDEAILHEKEIREIVGSEN